MSFRLLVIAAFYFWFFLTTCVCLQIDNTEKIIPDLVCLKDGKIKSKKYEEVRKMKEKVPQIGDVIYIPTALFLGHGRDDRIGGKDVVTHVKQGISAGELTFFIETGRFPGLWHNWEFLSQKQDRLRKEFGENWAYADPDERPEFNDW